ncbi:MAG TPA: SUMF1/EgtB/PvdO family nonheme iron enzyme [Myxococcales bacterium]|nr:SUMF1/EgtB/PvdO family nonheme iron enzyme [Myxococcales bacterium]
MKVAEGRTADRLVGQLVEARAFLWKAAAKVALDRWADSATPSYSPVGWHLGHVAVAQARWLLPGDSVGERYGAFFDPAQTAKIARGDLPSPDELRAFLAQVLDRARERLKTGPLPEIPSLPADFLVRHVAQHELQHGEHVQVIAALFENRLHRGAVLAKVGEPSPIEFRSGIDALLGNEDASEAYDNERPPRTVRVAPFWIDSGPATVSEYAEFVDAGGYRDKALWTEEGWRWREQNGVTVPLGWGDAPAHHPVSCLSWFEAEAYARFREARLPTEMEWEAARRAGLPGWGQVWEWTSSCFEPYPGFRAYPYDGYSTPWFGTHKVLRGGSWATHPRLKRPTFRNWHEPGFREIPAGVRCAGGL